MMIPQPRQIRSFVRRQGRMTPKQKMAYEQGWPKYGLSTDEEFLDFPTLFGRDAPTILEIGFGMGASLLELAKAHPELNFIGVDVHRPGIGALLAGMADLEIENIRIFEEDVNQVLNQSIKDNSLSKILVFFPDPWPKRKHQKRRLLQTPFLDLIQKKLKVKGEIHLATDWKDYANQMLSLLSAHPGFMNLSKEGGFMPNNDFRPKTKYEQRGERLGHDVFDLLFKKALTTPEK